jgi:hypothetical protein
VFQSAEGQRQGKVFRVCSNRKSATLQFTRILRPRVCWESKGLLRAPTPGYRKATDSRDTEGSKVRRAAEFEEAIFTRSPGKASRDRLIAESVTAHGYSQMEGSKLPASSTIRRSAESSQSQKSKCKALTLVPQALGFMRLSLVWELRALNLSWFRTYSCLLCFAATQFRERRQRLCGESLL